MVSFSQALLFCNQLAEKWGAEPSYNYAGECWTILPTSKTVRLLSLDEWQYVAHAMRPKPDLNEREEQAWTCQNSRGMMHPVAQKKPNAWGLYDIWGGMEEWVWGAEKEALRVGGSWYHDVDVMGETKKSTYDVYADTIGFRIVLVEN